MAAYDAQREFGIDLGSLRYRTLKDYLSHEQDMLRLRTMIRRCKHTDTYDVAIPQDTNTDVWTMMFKGKVRQVFRDIAERTRTTGSVGMFAGADAAGFIKMLPPTMFTAAENYAGSVRSLHRYAVQRHQSVRNPVWRLHRIHRQRYRVPFLRHPVLLP